MSLNKGKLISDLSQLFDDTVNGNSNEKDAKTNFVNGLASAIEAFVKTASVKYTSGLMAPNGAVTGTINHTIE